jgi:hypothetical protein
VDLQAQVQSWWFPRALQSSLGLLQFHLAPRCGFRRNFQPHRQPGQHRTITALQQEFSMKDLGELHHFLGMQVQRCHGGLFLSQC